MDNYLNVILRSVIEAITEFLPVSSTGHLFLFTSFFPFRDIGQDSEKFDDLFDIFIQSGAILSVIVLYFHVLRQRTWQSLTYLSGKTSDKTGFQFSLAIVIGSIPVMAVGFLLKDFLDVIKSRPDLLLILGLSWLIGGIAIILAEKKFANREEIATENTTVFTIRSAFIVGMFQCIALIPGVSRSATTIITARILGYSKKDSAEFSFFLAIPVLVAAGIYKLYKYRDILGGEKITLLALGFFLSFLFCLGIIKWFLAFIKKYSFSAFGYYRILLGGVVLFIFFF